MWKKETDVGRSRNWSRVDFSKSESESLKLCRLRSNGVNYPGMYERTLGQKAQAGT